MSHMRIVQDAIHDKLSSYCVLEDDVVFHPRSKEMLSHIMAEVSDDWGQLYLGGQFLHREPERITPWIMRPYNVNRTHAFALSSNAFVPFHQHIINAPDYFKIRLDSIGNVVVDHNKYHIDHQLGRAHELSKWNTYAPTWWLAGQEQGSSNISGNTNPRLWWHWRDRGRQLPFFFVPCDTPKRHLRKLSMHLHAGNNLAPNTMIDIGLKRDMSDTELLEWLKLIAGEALEQWKLPSFQSPRDSMHLLERVIKLWPPGVREANSANIEEAADYPFNSLFTGIACNLRIRAI